MRRVGGVLEAGEGAACKPNKHTGSSPSAKSGQLCQQLQPVQLSACQAGKQPASRRRTARAPHLVGAGGTRAAALGGWLALRGGEKRVGQPVVQRRRGDSDAAHVHYVRGLLLRPH